MDGIICDSDGGIILGYFSDKNIAEDIVKRLNECTQKETEKIVRNFACNICCNIPLDYTTEHEHLITELLVSKLGYRILTEPLDLKFHED